MKNKQLTKLYNPFKMWGSWVGAVVGYFSVIPSIIILIVFGLCIGEFCENSGAVAGFFSKIIPAILGFFLGWGIHSLVKRLYDGK